VRLATGVLFAVLSLLTLTVRAETLPDVLRRVAPKVVRVQYDEDSIGTGFVYPDDRHITTAYSVVNRKGEPEVVLRTGAVFKVKVVAWSEEDDLAILELPVSSGQRALELEPSEPYAGEDVVLMGFPHSSKESKEEQRRRRIPTPRFGKVSVISATQVTVDVDNWGGDDGAPFITEAGRVLGVLSGNREKRLGGPDAALPARVAALSQRLNKQGKFEPHLRTPKGFFAAVYMSPLQPDRMIGAGLLSGFRYGHFATNWSITISRGSYIPTSSSESHAITQLAVDLVQTWDFNVAKDGKLAFGVGLSGALSFQSNKVNGMDLKYDPKRDGASRIDPVLAFQDIADFVIIGASWMPTRRAARLDLGIVFNRL
jgi:hypothetical protein